MIHSRFPSAEPNRGPPLLIVEKSKDRSGEILRSISYHNVPVGRRPETFAPDFGGNYRDSGSPSVEDLQSGAAATPQWDDHAPILG